MKEEWRPVKGYEGYYEVSNFGRIYSVNRKEKCGNCSRKRNGRILKGLPTRGGYLRVALMKFSRAKYRSIHRIVLEAFSLNCPEGKQCNHKNGIKADNSLENLEWVTPSENAIHAFRNGLRFGIPHHMKKIKRSDGKKYISIHSAARENECAHQGIVSALRGRIKTYLGFKWSYLGGNK